MRHCSGLVAALLLTLGQPLSADAPPRDIAPPVEEVRDEFVGYLLGMLQHDLSVDMTGSELNTLFPEYDDGKRTPMDVLSRFTRDATDAARPIVIRFGEPLAHPAPLDILGYTPAWLYGTAELVLREERVVLDPVDTSGRNPASDEMIEFAYLLHIEEGSLEVDFAGWLDFILGSIVDDVDVRIVYAIRYQEIWYGAMVGLNPKGRLVTGVYDMRRNRFMARPPKAVSAFALAGMERQL